MIRNLALGFIKPHAAKSAATWDWIRATLARRGVAVSAERLVTGPEIWNNGLIDRHYTVIARIGGCTDPRVLELNDQARAAFLQAFGLSWQAAADRHLIFSGMAALTQLNVSPTALMTLWSGAKTAKIGPGFYAATIHGIYVLNGFYPSIREIYTEENGFIRCFLMEFYGEQLHWKQFRAEVIGATDPAKATSGSIRGTLFQRRQEFGLSMDSRDNVIHASASPFEAMTERSIWMPEFDLDLDPLMQELSGMGISPQKLAELACGNPVITLNGKTASAIDHLEDTDTPAAAALIRQMGLH